MATTLIDKHEVVRRTGYSNSQIYRLEKKGLFPKRLRLGEAACSKSVWVESEIEDFLQKKIADRSGEAA